MVDLSLTSAQAGLVAESLGQPDAGFNIEQVVLRFEKDAPTPVQIRAAFDSAARRFDSLRLIMSRDVTGEVTQHIVPVVEIWQDTQDWSALSNPMARLEEWLQADRQAGFALDGKPLWRVFHAFTGPGRAVVVWTLHHAITDLDSMARVLDDVGARLVGDVPDHAADKPFAEFVQWAAVQDRDSALAYFGSHLDGYDGATLPRGAQSAERRTLSKVLGADLAQALVRRAVQSGATATNLIQLAFGLALARWSGQDRATIGLTQAGWAAWHPARDISGCQIATLPLFQRLTAEQPLGAHLAYLRAATRAHRKYHPTSTATLRDAAGLAGGERAFEAVLSVVPRALPDMLHAPIWQGAHVQLCEKGAAPITLAAHLEPDLHLVLEHDPALLGASQASRFLEHIANLLGAMVDAPDDLPLGALNMLGNAEQTTLLARARPDQGLPDSLPCPATRFAQMAVQRPGATAVTCATTGASLTYAALDARANGLAQALHAQGAEQNAIIAIDLPRGLDFVVSLLGILKIGGTAMPLDPALAPSQKAALIAQACPAVVIGQKGLDPAQAVPQPVPPVLLNPDPARAAYLIFTSGSTGQPKGVLGSCGALSAHADAIIRTFGLGVRDRCLGFAGLGFDVALEEIVPTLLSGAQLVLRNDAAAQSLSDFHALIAQHQISVLNLPASFWHVLVEDMDTSARRLPASVRLCVTGSERVRPDMLARWQFLAPAIDWMNGYGPTEATITSTIWALPAGSPPVDADRDIPIGRPLAHARAYIRAMDGTLAPDGAEGVLWLGGRAVALGYLHQPEATAQAFHTDLFHDSGRLYNTGDRVRWNEDGTLDFLGRRDRQVKLRGHRIDLNGVERVLANLPGVSQVHVALDRAGSAQAQLLGWIVPDPKAASPDLQGLRARIAQNLPLAARPYLIVVDSLPVSPNGKIATASLPRPATPSAALQTGQDVLVDQIAGLMAQVLGRAHVGPDQDFHDLGGDSLSAVRLALLAERKLQRKVVAMDIHQNPTPAALAAALRQGMNGSSYIVPIQPNGTKPAFFAVHVLGPKESQWRPLSDALGPDFPFFGISVGAPRTLEEIDIPSIAEVYFCEIQKWHPTGPLILGATSMASYYAYDLAQRLIEAGRDVRLVVAFDAMGPGGRPSLSGVAKLGAHLRQFLQRGFGHVSAVREARRLKRQIERDTAEATDGAVTGINIIEATAQAVDRYAPAPISAPMLVFRANTSFWDSQQALGTCLGWSHVAKAGIRMVDVPGEHLTILEPGNVEVLAARLRDVVADQGRD